MVRCGCFGVGCVLDGPLTARLLSRVRELRVRALRVRWDGELKECGARFGQAILLFVSSSVENEAVQRLVGAVCF